MFNTELNTAINLAIAAGEEIMRLHKDGFEVETKKLNHNFTEPVTSADKRANELIVSELKNLFSEDGILSEESEDDLNRLDKKRVWIIDPIDGTKGFVEGADDFAVQIGFVYESKPVVGVVYQPAQKRLFFASENKGAFLVENEKTPRRLHVNEKNEIDDMILAVSRLHKSPKLSEITSRLRFKQEIQHGSVGLKIGLIAEGKADIYIHLSPHTKLWDTCAPQVILEESGGILTDLFGEKLNYHSSDTQNYNGILATSRACHEQILSKLIPILKEIGRLKLKKSPNEIREAKLHDQNTQK